VRSERPHKPLIDRIKPFLSQEEKGSLGLEFAAWELTKDFPSRKGRGKENYCCDRYLNEGATAFSSFIRIERGWGAIEKRTHRGG